MKRLYLAHVGVVSVGLLIMIGTATRSDELPNRAEAPEEPQRPIIRLGGKRYPSGVAFGPNGEKIVTCSRGESGGVWSTADGHQILGIANPAYGLFAVDVAMSGDGRRIVTGGPSIYEEEQDLLRGTIRRHGSLARLWDAESGRLIRTFIQGNVHYFKQVAVNRSATRVACADYGLNTILWDGTDGKVISRVDGPDSCTIADGPCSTMFSADATRFVAISVNIDDQRSRLIGRPRRSLYACDLNNRHTLTIPPMPDGSHFGPVALSGDGNEIAALLYRESAKQALVRFDFATGRIKAKIPVPKAVAHYSYFAYSPDGSMIALGDATGKVFLIDRASGMRIAKVTSGAEPIRAIGYHHGSVLVISESSDTKLDERNREATLHLREHKIPLFRP